MDIKPAGLDEFNSKINDFISEVKTDAKDGYTFTELGTITHDFLHLATQEVELVKVASGSDKKAIVIDALGQLFDVVYPNIPFPIYLQPFKGISSKAVRPLFIEVGDGIIESILAKRKQGTTI